MFTEQNLEIADDLMEALEDWRSTCDVQAVTRDGSSLFGMVLSCELSHDAEEDWQEDRKNKLCMHFVRKGIDWHKA